MQSLIHAKEKEQIEYRKLNTLESLWQALLGRSDRKQYSSNQIRRAINTLLYDLNKIELVHELWVPIRCHTSFHDWFIYFSGIVRRLSLSLQLIYNLFIQEFVLNKIPNIETGSSKNELLKKFRDVKDHRMKFLRSEPTIEYEFWMDLSIYEGARISAIILIFEFHYSYEFEKIMFETLKPNLNEKERKNDLEKFCILIQNWRLFME